MVSHINAHVHESFNVSNKKRGKRAIRLRQERVNSTDIPCSLTIGGEPLKVVDYSAIGIAILSDRKLDKEMYRIPFNYADTNVVNLDLHEKRCDLLGSGEYRIAYEISGEPLDFDRLQGVQVAHDLISHHKKDFMALAQLPSSIKARVYEITDWLEQLKTEINAICKEEEFTDQMAQEEFEEAIIEQIADYFTDMFPMYIMAFAQEIQHESDDVKKLAIEFLREKLQNQFFLAPLTHRVFSKPLGYAGDYEMMNIIYRSEAVGKTLFVRCLQRYCVNEPSAQAIRNRVEYFVQKITDVIQQHSDPSEPIRILSVACGPAMEWQKIIPHIPDGVQLEVDLLDQDEQALLSTQRQLKRLLARYPKAIKFRYLNKAIKNIIVRGTDHQSYNLVYSSGLFDYLSDSVSAMAASRLLQGIIPGGQLIIGNFNVGNPNQLVMDYALDWPLIYRSESDLNSLFKNLEGSILIESEPLGINLFCVITKPT